MYKYQVPCAAKPDTYFEKLYKNRASDNSAYNAEKNDPDRS